MATSYRIDMSRNFVHQNLTDDPILHFGYRRRLLLITYVHDSCLPNRNSWIKTFRGHYMIVRCSLFSLHRHLASMQPESSLPSTSASNPQHHLQPSTPSSQLYPVREAPPVTTITSHPSFQMSSQLALHSSMYQAKIHSFFG